MDTGHPLINREKLLKLLSTSGFSAYTALRIFSLFEDNADSETLAGKICEAILNCKTESEVLKAIEQFAPKPSTKPNEGHDMTIETRYLTPESLDEIYKIETACFPTPWEYDVLKHDITENSCARYLGVYVDGVLSGYGCFWLMMEEAHITNVAVLPAFRRQGAGETLMRALIQAAADCGARFMELECRASNKPAQSLYHKLSFIRVGCRKGYYTDTNEDAYIYALIAMPQPHPENDPYLQTE